MCQGLVVQLVDLCAGHRPLCPGIGRSVVPQVQGVHDMGTDQTGVAGDHLDIHGGPVKILDGGGGGLFGRIQEGQETDEHHVCLVGRGVVPVVMDEMGAGRVGSDDAGRHCEDSHAVRIQRLGGCDGRGAGGVVQGSDTAVVHHPGAHGHDFAYRALGEQQILARGQMQLLRADVLDLVGRGQLVQVRDPVEDHRQSASLEVERYLVDNPIGRQRRAGRFVHRTDDGIIHGVAHSGRVHGIEVSDDQRQLTRLSFDVEVTLQDDPVLGECAGLVGAQHIHRAEILDGVGDLDDHLARGHEAGAAGQVRGNDRG
ncbi:hypothetical protein SDC9_120243 [bioreactor metagenome]|uniref:Uncharacterized protein n=1 Tax=bioreactor metagenome TaxID=1076179 RepID=A0A645C7S3_9ZZZZ